MKPPSFPALSRRSFIARTAVGASGALLATSFAARLRAEATTASKIPDDILFTSTKRLAKMIQDKKISSVELLTAYYKRIDEVNPKLNAVVFFCRERAFTEAKLADEALAKGKVFGPLHGVPCTIKDSHETLGIVSTGGTMGRKGYIPSRDAACVARV
ncbi:MAG TPA: amidase family protein, partial [Opitutaceae bacterium]|nr:amidase family protein [Opitutaceae bacterium]